MATSYECFSCHKVFGGVSEHKCPSCGKTNGQILSEDRLKEGLNGDVIFPIDPKTGKRPTKRK